MFKSCFSVAIRIFQRDTLYSAINILGLVVGLVVCVLVILYGRHELNYDRWLPDSDSIYRYEASSGDPGQELTHNSTSNPVVRGLLTENFEQIPSIVRVIETPLIIEAPDKRRILYNVRFVDPNFFEVFDLPLLSGDKSSALATTNSLLISETTAALLFGSQNPVGQTINTNNMRNTDNDFRKKRSADNPLMERDYVVSGVFRDIPSNSHLVFDLIAPFVDADPFPRYYGNWAFQRGSVYTYLKLKSPAQEKEISAQLPTFTDKYLPPPKDHPNLKASDLYQPKLIGLHDIHYGATGLNNIKPAGDIRRLYAATGIAVLILTIACINFVNLTVAKSTLRSKEVAVRKILGASKRQLIIQFLSETMLFAFFSLFIAVVCLELIVPTFNNFVGITVAFEPFSDLGLAGALVLLTLFMGLLGGLYPAFIVSRYRPAKTLQTEQSSMAKGSKSLRFGLVIVQFSIAVTLGLIAVTFYQQNDFIETAPLGFSSQNKIIISDINEPAFIEYRDVITREIRRLSGVKGATLSKNIPTDNFRVNSGGKASIAGDPGKTMIGGIALSVDHYFLQAYEIPLIAGRYFSEEFAQDQFRPPVDPKIATPLVSVIWSETRARRVGFKSAADAVGKYIQAPGGGAPIAVIIGIVADVKYQSLHKQVQPQSYIVSPYIFDKLTVAYENEDVLPEVLKGVEEIWQRYTPERPLKYEFLDSMIRNKYEAERKQAQLIAASAGLAILVACIGLFAISVLVSELRSQEIVIRRIFGASTPSLVKLLVTQFSIPIVIANLISWPLGYYFMRQYLDEYAHRIDLSVYVFLGVSLITLVIGWGTISAHILKMVNLKPANILRHD